MTRGRVPPPIWLREPSRFAGISRGRAIAALLAIAALVLASLGAVGGRAAPVGSGGVTDGQSDLALYDGIADGVRHGGNYYTVAADALRAGGYPLRPFVAFRLPTLALVQAWLPVEVVPALLYLLALCVALTWYARLRAAVTGRIALATGLALLASGLAAFVQPGLVGFHEIWAGLLIALSLGLRRPGRWVEPVAIALAAMLVRETAALYVGVMGLFALIEGRRAETAGWATAAAVFAVVVGLHAHAVAQVLRPLDPASPGWSGLLGWGFVVRTMTLSTALRLLPGGLAAIAVALAPVGWAAWRDPLAARALATVLSYDVLLGVASRADTFYWGLMIAPILLPGLLFVPDGMRALAAAALDRRRISVTRVTR